MSPLLFQIPSPGLVLPLPWILAALAAAGLAIVLVAGLRREHHTAISLCGAGVSVGSALGAWLLAGHRVTIPAFSVSSFGTALAISVVLSWRLTIPLATLSGMSATRATGAGVATLVGSVLGARILYCALELPAGAGPWVWLNWSEGGLSADGAVIGAAVGAWLFLRARISEWWIWGESAAPSWGLSVAVLSFGTFLSGSGFGRLAGGNGAPRTLGWVAFPQWTDWASTGTGSPAWQHHRAQGWISMAAHRSLPVHPTQIYLALTGILLLGVAAWYQHRRGLELEARPGAGLLSVGFAYGVARFALGFWGDDPARPRLPLDLAPSQGAALGAGMVVLLAIAAGVGPLGAIKNKRLRRGRWGIAAAGAALLWLIIGGLPGGNEPFSGPWDITQAFGVALAVGVAMIWRRRFQVVDPMVGAGAAAALRPEGGAPTARSERPSLPSDSGKVKEVLGEHPRNGLKGPPSSAVSPPAALADPPKIPAKKTPEKPSTSPSRPAGHKGRRHRPKGRRGR